MLRSRSRPSRIVSQVATTAEVKTALITGAGSGIGRALATELSGRGYRVHLLDIDEQSVVGLANDLDLANPICGDVSDATTMTEVAATTGAVDVLCLNAGVADSSPGAPWEASPQEWSRVLGINLLGVVNGLRSFVPLMLEQQTPRQIIITASLAGAATWPGGGPYAASKHATLAVAEQTALELSETNIDVTVLCPALVKTAMSDTGVDPNAVAIEALEAASDGRFAVIPAEWRAAVEKRTTDLTGGHRPSLPTPEAPQT